MSNTINPDLPIASASGDRLNRSGFAQALAKAILGWDQPSSLVIGLYGDWGSGKSSLKNMALESLRNNLPPKEYLPVLEFNPWQMGSHDALVRSFFSELGTALGRQLHGETKEAAEKRSSKWQAYASYLAIGGSIAKSLKVVLPLVGIPLVGDIIGAAVEALTETSKVTKEGGEGIAAEGQAGVRTLAELKSEVTEELRALPRPLLVVLDDVDRLTQDEIRLLFQLIKANADFPKVVYLVLAQRESVVRALESVAPGQAAAFLEKIVQVGLHVPQIHRQQLEAILFAGLDNLLADEVVNKRFSKERWASVYREGVGDFFSNLRDVGRYISSLSFHWGVFRSSTTFEVNPVDLIALETLRVFVPEVYSRLPEAKHLLTDQPRFMRKEEREQDRKVLEAILEAAPESKREAATTILKTLFPPIQPLLAGHHFRDDTGDSWFKDLRASSHKVFDRYFQFGTPATELSQTELEEILGLVGDRSGLFAKFKQLESRKLLNVTLDNLDYYRRDLPVEHIGPCVTALMDLDAEAKDELFSVSFGPQTHIQRIIHWYLRREPDQLKRKDLLLQAMTDTSGLSTPVHTADWLRTKVSEPGQSDPDALLEDPKLVEEVRRAALNKIKAAADSMRLESDPQLSFLLGYWNRFDAPGAKVWVQGQIATDEGALRFLRTTRSTTTSYGGALPKETHYIRLDNVEIFVDSAQLSSRLHALKSKSLSVDDASNIKLFEKALARRAKGLSDQDGPLWPDSD